MKFREQPSPGRGQIQRNIRGVRLATERLRSKAETTNNESNSASEYAEEQMEQYASDAVYETTDAGRRVVRYSAEELKRNRMQKPGSDMPEDISEHAEDIVYARTVTPSEARKIYAEGCKEIKSTALQGTRRDAPVSQTTTAVQKGRATTISKSKDVIENKRLQRTSSIRENQAAKRTASRTASRASSRSVVRSASAKPGAITKPTYTKLSAQNAAKNAHRTKAAVQAAAKATVKAAKAAALAVKNAIKAIIAGTKALVAAVGTGGAIAVIMIVVVCLVGLIVASPFGVFFSGEDTGTVSMNEVVMDLSKEFYDEIESIENHVAFDYLDVSSTTGALSIAWEDVLSVYSIMLSTDPNDATEVVTLDEGKIAQLREILFDMNDISYHTTVSTREIEVEVEVEKTDENGDTYIEIEKQIEVIEETTLHIFVRQLTAEQQAAYLGFSAEQNDIMAELRSDAYASNWIRVIGSYAVSGGIIITDADWIPTGPFAWPLPFNGSFNSGFGYRHDPYSGELKLHAAIDLGAAEGTPILAAADGVVTAANATDSWGFGYGYHVKLQHVGGYDTMYGHCSAICVYPGQSVKKGEVIAYVGSTGKSTGNHLHFEVYEGGTRVDPLRFFRQ